MQLGDITNFVGDSGQAKVPDLDWLKLDISEKDNIPTPNHVEILPQLVENWSHTSERSTPLIPNQVSVPAMASKKASAEEIKGVTDRAKVEMMKGLVGKALASKLATLFEPSLVIASKDELIKLAQEQGLLGKVYVDLSVFDTCKEAAMKLGHDKVRMAKYVTGSPKRACCSSHSEGYCKELRKKVVASMEYGEDILNEYTNHLRVAGYLAADKKVASKEELRDAIVNSTLKKAKKEDVKKEATPFDIEPYKEAFEKQLEKSAQQIHEEYHMSRFEEVKPILASIQNEMLQGKIGRSLKEAIAKSVDPSSIKNYESEIRKVASLQGLLGNVYVDVSYYSSPEQAVAAIKKASTSPAYVVQTVNKGQFDNTLEKVAKATGCAVLPRDGKIEAKVAHSYIDDLRFSDKISSEVAKGLKDQVEAGENVLGVLRDAFLAKTNHKKKVKEGGIKARYAMPTRKSSNKGIMKQAAAKAISAGIPMGKIVDKMSTSMPTPEAEGMVRDVLAKLEVVDAESLDRCKVERYQFAKNARIKKAFKCSDCIHHSCSTCLKMGVKFASEDKMSIQIDPKTSKVLLPENPDIARSDLKQEYDMDTVYGSNNSNILDQMIEAGDPPVNGEQNTKWQ